MRILLLIFIMSCSSVVDPNNKVEPIVFKALNGGSNAQLKIYDSENSFHSLSGDSIAIILNKKTYVEFNSSQTVSFYINEIEDPSLEF